MLLAKLFAGLQGTAVLNIAELYTCYKQPACPPCRESRAEDVAQIQQLSSLVTSQATELQASEDKLQQMRAELLLREDNYNKTFSNGGAGRRTLAVDKALTTQSQVVDWMLKSGPRKKILEEKPRSYRMTK